MEQNTLRWVAVTMVVQDELAVDVAVDLAVEGLSSFSGSGLSWPPPPPLSLGGQLPILRPNSWMQNLGTLISTLGGNLVKQLKHTTGGPSKGKITGKRQRMVTM